MKFTTDTILPTTMVGSYPRPKWFTHQLDGRDIRVETTPPLSWQADGELMGTTPFHVVVEPLAVRLLVPSAD